MYSQWPTSFDTNAITIILRPKTLLILDVIISKVYYLFIAFFFHIAGRETAAEPLFLPSTNLAVGMRLPSAQVVRFSDTQAMQHLSATC